MSKLDPISAFIFFQTHAETLMQSIENSKDVNMPEDLLKSHLLILLVVDREFGSNQKQIADRLFISKQSVGVSIDYLIKKKYISKSKDPVDARAFLIKLTDKGWKIIEAIKHAFKNELDKWKDSMGSKKYKRLWQIINSQ